MGLDGVYSIVLFHGQPSKGLTFSPEVLNSFDAPLLTVPMHREALDDFVSERLSELPHSSHYLRYRLSEV